MKKEPKTEIGIIEMETEAIAQTHIDFEDPKSIIEYGKDIIGNISDILANTAVIASPVSELALDMSDIEGLTKLDDSLHDVEESLAKKQPRIVKSIRKGLSRFGLSKPKEEISYQQKYSKYCEMIDVIVKAVESQRSASAQDMNLRKAMINELLPLIEQLEQTLLAGELEKAGYDAETEEMKEKLYTGDDTLNLDLQYEIQNREQISQIFNSRLDELKRALLLYKEQIQSYRLQQSTEATFLMGCTSFLNSTAPILKAQGSVMAFNYQQQKRLDTVRNLNQAANDAISNNAVLLQKNAQDAVNLMLENGINVDTIERLSTALEQGIKIFKQGEEQRQKMIASNNQRLQQLNTIMDSYKEQIVLLEANLGNDQTTSTVRVKRLSNGNN